MKAAIHFELPIPAGISGFKLPPGVKRRLEYLLDRQDSGTPLIASERREAEGLVDLAEFLFLLKQRTKRPTKAA